jgi:hypothetical protein
VFGPFFAVVPLFSPARHSQITSAGPAPESPGCRKAAKSAEAGMCLSFRQLHAPASAGKQWAAVVLLKPGNSFAQGRLTDIQLLDSSGDILVPGRAEKDFDQTQVDGRHNKQPLLI